MDHVDLAIIGSGSGNSLVTPDFADAQVAVIEQGVFGGTCLNVGCIPTKMYVHTADLAVAARDSARFGVDSRVDAVRWRDIRDRIFGRIDPISRGGRDYRLTGPGTTAYLGHARFTGDRTLDIALNDGGRAQVRAEQVVIATGARPVIPDVISASGVPFHTSDDVMRMDELPASMVILGGGYLAAEFAHIFSALGVAVTLVVRGPRLLRRQDFDISAAFTERALAQWDVRLGRGVVSAGTTEDGIRLGLDDGTAASADVLLVATGRRPNTDDLGLEAAKVACHEDGRVVVDAHGRTTAPGVWALGDASSPYQLKHVANHEARVVAHNLAHPKDLRSFDHAFVPAAVFSRPQIATVGATQQQLEAEGRRFAVKLQKYGDTAFGWALEDEYGVCKVLADPATGLLLGVHLMGEFASTVIQPAIQAMSFRQRADEVARGQYWIHPALSEVLENALLGVELDPPGA